MSMIHKPAPRHSLAGGIVRLIGHSSHICWIQLLSSPGLGGGCENVWEEEEEEEEPAREIFDNRMR